jgi:hypothetical protein
VILNERKIVTDVDFVSRGFPSLSFGLLSKSNKPSTLSPFAANIKSLNRRSVLAALSAIDSDIIFASIICLNVLKQSFRLLLKLLTSKNVPLSGFFEHSFTIESVEKYLCDFKRKKDCLRTFKQIIEAKMMSESMADKAAKTDLRFNDLIFMTKTLNQIFLFPPPKSEYFFQRHWESEYFFRTKSSKKP